MKKRIFLWLFFLLAAAVITWKLYSNKKELETEAELSKVARAFVPVEVTRPQMETLANTLQADGIFLPVKEMFVISETAGRVLETYKNKGEWVTEGDLIAKVDDELLRIELEATQANLAKLRKDQERLANLIEGEAAPKNKIEDLQLGLLAAEAKEKGLKKQIANTSIKAPMTGTMGLRFIERGSVIGPGIQVAQITNLEKLFLMIKVTERDVLNIRKGQIVKVIPDVYPDAQVIGKVTNIGLRADNAFNYDVEIEVPNPKNTPMRAGMHAKAMFTFDANRQGLTLPRKAIAGSLQEAKVYVVVQDSLVEVRTIRVGGVYHDKVEVLSGLQQQDQVVVTGQLNLSDGAKVQVLR
ncbi:MAG: efflux RND transporter periplasmic adaptor subunit [Saprospiraceae bacterium]|nr:efflux RND transporter periplasmic adaptor subunit [Saprospiraceae bacterium]